MKFPKLSLSTSILIGLILGILCGVFFGNLISFLSYVGTGFIGLLQMTILPYIVVSLISGIGSLTVDKAKTLLIKGGLWLLVFWLISFVIVFLMLLIFPDWASSSFFSTSMVEPQPSVDLISLYIPANPFSALVNSFIPAIVVFCVLMGASLIFIPQKDALLNVLNTLQTALVKMTGYVVKLTPIGVFALAADAASSLSVGEITKLQVYIIGFVIASILITFLLLPSLIAMATPIKAKEIIALSKDIIVTAFTTGNLFVVLPQMTEMCKKLIQDKKLETPSSKHYIDILVPVSFNFPNIGKLLLLYFVLFSMWFNSTPLTIEQTPSFTLTGLFTLFGGVDVALPFLLNFFHIPSDMYSLYVVTGIIIGRFSTMVAAMNLIAFTLLSTLSITNNTKFKVKKIVSFASVNLVIFIFLFVGLRLFFNNFVTNPYDKDDVLKNMHTLQKPIKSIVNETSPFNIVNEYENLSTLERILTTGEIRIGYYHNFLPFSFFNNKNDLVGFDIDLINMLAEDLNVVPVFYKIETANRFRAINEKTIDILLTGASTPTSMQYINFSQPYIIINAGLIVPDYSAKHFNTMNKIRSMDNLTIGINLSDTYLIGKVGKLFKNATFVKTPSNESFLTSNPESNPLDAIFCSAEQGAALTLLHPKFKMVIPQDLKLKQTIGFGIKPDDYEWANYLNNWIYLTKESYEFKDLYDYWILGIDKHKSIKSWSIIKDVLHWVD